MKNTPLDYLLHDVLLGKDRHPASRQFFELLTQHPLSVYYWPDWSAAHGEHLPHAAVGTTFGPPGRQFCLFSPDNIDGCRLHRPTIVSAAEGLINMATPYVAWTLDCILVYRLDELNFDVIGIMRDTSTQRLLPEIQIRFVKTPNGWTWRISNTGFVNPYIYGATLSEIPEDALHEAVEYYGNSLSLYLGGYHAWLRGPGVWDVREPKQGKVKAGKDGKIKKFYRIASSGYKTYRPTLVNYDKSAVCDTHTAESI